MSILDKFLPWIPRWKMKTYAKALSCPGCGSLNLSVFASGKFFKCGDCKESYYTKPYGEKPI